MALNYKNIVVAVDGSKEAEYAFKKAVAIANRNEAALYLVNIIDTRSFAAIEAYDRSIQERAQEFAEELLEGYKKEAETSGVKDVNVLSSSILSRFLRFPSGQKSHCETRFKLHRN